MEKRIGFVIDKETGAVVAGATVQVNQYPGGSAATIYSDNGVTAKANPLTTDANGRYEYYAANGRYTETVTTSAGAQPAMNDILLNDPVSAQSSSAVASANNLTLSADQNRFQISGTTQINLIASTGWWGGARITLHFQGSLTVAHNQTASGVNKPIMLVGAANFSATASDQLVLEYDSVDAKWYEVSRAVI